MRSIPFLNLSFLAFFVVLASLLFLWSNKTVTSVDQVVCEKNVVEKRVHLPKNPFQLEESAYTYVGLGPLKLKWSAPQLQLPDLRGAFSYFGKNVRPDLAIEYQEKGCFALSLKTTAETRTIQGGQKCYFHYQGGAYRFSQNNEPTPLWVELKGKDEEIEVTVYMQGVENAIVKEPKEFHQFKIPCQELKVPSNFSGEIGGQRVDTALLMRQHARWAGKDLFLNIHGGDEFAHTASRERIDFQIEDNVFSCFVKEGDYLIWKEGRWRSPEKGERTAPFPLLYVKKVDENSMQFELWDAEGKGRIPLSIFRAKVHEPIPDPAVEFKFIAAKTWAQFIVECRGKRMVLKSDDWLCLTKEGWIKLSTPQEIDLFVSSKIHGPLFVVEKLQKDGGTQHLSGHIFNASRTDMKEVELALSINTTAKQTQEEESIQDEHP